MTVKETIATEAAASEATRDEPIPVGGTGTRPGRPRAAVLSVRLNPTELDALTAQARTRGVPTSTLARSLIVQGLRVGARIDVSDALRDVVVLTVRETVTEVLDRVLSHGGGAPDSRGPA